MAWSPESKRWSGDRAVLFVHGVGNTQPGDYDPLVESFEAIFTDAGEMPPATYFLYYDELNDWVSRKTRLAQNFEALVGKLRGGYGAAQPGRLSEVASEFGGDVLFPVLLEPAFVAVQSRIADQLGQMRIDGKQGGIGLKRQRISIICHSLGCFHVYEALHRFAARPDLGLHPVGQFMQFDNVIFMASPVQLIRTVAGGLGSVVPDGLASVAGSKLQFPGAETRLGDWKSSSKRWISITGNLDPVGGHVFREKLGWAYMDVEGQESIIDQQDWVDANSVADAIDLAKELGAAAVNNPHSWGDYVDRHATDLKGWLA